jgi:hypothetical protein
MKCVETKRVLKTQICVVFHSCNAKAQKMQICVTRPQCVKNALKQGEPLLSMLFNFALEYAIKRVHVNQETLKLHATHQLLVYADNVNVS